MLKNKFLKILALVFCANLLFGILNPTVFADWTIEVTDMGKILTVTNNTPGELRKEIGASVVNDFEHIVIKGKMNESDFGSLNVMMIGGRCKTIDLSRVIVNTIPEFAFYMKENLMKIVLPIALRKIEKQAFWSCTKLKIDELPPRLQNIEDRAFCHCINLNLTIPPTIKLGENVFFGCPKVKLH